MVQHDENNREDIANQIEETVGKYTNDSVSKIIRKISKGAVEQAIDEIKEEIEELGKYEEHQSRGSATEDNRTPSPTEIQTPVSFKGEEVDLDDNITARQNLIEVLNYMFSEGYLSVAEDVPLERGRKRYLVNEEPFDSEEDRMIDEKQLKMTYMLKQTTVPKIFRIS